MATPPNTPDATQTSLTPAELAAFQQSLQEEVVRLRAELAEAQHEIGTDFADNINTPGDIADHGSVAGDIDANTSLAFNVRQLLAQCELALERIAGGRYGRCDRCGLAISTERLQALPRATLCLTCQQHHRD